MADGCYDGRLPKSSAIATKAMTPSAAPVGRVFLTGVWADKHGVLDNASRFKHYRRVTRTSSRG